MPIAVTIRPRVVEAESNPRTIRVVFGSVGPRGPAGEDGEPGPGLPPGGTPGQVPVKASGTDYDTEWSRSITSEDGRFRAEVADDYAAVTFVDGDVATEVTADALGAVIYATDGTNESSFRANGDGKAEVFSSSGEYEAGGDPVATQPWVAGEVAGRVPVGPWRSGRYYTQPRVSFGTSAGTLNILGLTPLWVPNSCTVDRIACEVTAIASAGGVFRLGLYANDPAIDRPSSLIVDAGAVATDASTGIKEVGISESVPAGWVWVAGVGQVAAATLRGISGQNLSPVATTAPITPHSAAFYVAGVSGALPETVSPTLATAAIQTWLRVA